jgi:hypothetical protein
MEGRIKGAAYGFTLFLITLTGFAQMPVFKRYYIADIPGLGWLSQFYVTHSIHYIMASVFLALCVYGLVDLLINGRGLGALTLSGLIKGGLILGLVVSGGLMVVRNLPGVYFSHLSIYLMNLLHLGFCMVLIMVSAFTWVAKKRWIH